MPWNKRIFIAFAMEDKFARDNLVFQAKYQRDVPFDFIDMSVKEPWDETWKTNCRTKIKGCHGVIAFISRNTPKAEGACWEIRCAKAEGIPIKGFWIHKETTLVANPKKWESLQSFIGLGTTSPISSIRFRVGLLLRPLRRMLERAGRICLWRVRARHAVPLLKKGQRRNSRRTIARGLPSITGTSGRYLGHRQECLCY
jgi:hypothetical protein